MAENFGSFIKKHAEAQEQNIEYLKSIAESQIGGEKYNTKDRLNARRQLAAMEKTLEQQMAATGFSKKQAQTVDIMNMGIQEQKDKMDAQKAELESLGIKAEGNKKFQKEERKLAKMELAAAKASGSKDAEADAKKKLSDLKSNTFLGKIAGGIGGILKGTKDKVKGGLDGFKKFAFGALAIAALAFLNNPKFEEIKKTILDVVIPAVAYIYDNVIKPLAEYIGGKLKNLFVDLKAYVDGEKGIGTVLMDNIGIVSAIALALGVKVLGFSAMLTGAKGIGTALLWVAKGGPLTLISSAATKIGAAFTTLKTFLSTTLLPVITTKLAAIKSAFAVGISAGIKAVAVALAPVVAVVAGIALVIYSLKQAFDDFMFELEATGSVWEAVKTGIVSVIANLFGFPLDLIKDGVSWILRKIGEAFGLDSFVNAADSLDDFSFVDLFKKGLEWIGDWFGGMFDSMKQLAQDVLKKIPGGETLSNWIFGTKEEQEAEKKREEEEQKQFELKRQALKEKKRLEKEAEEAKELAAAKKKEAAMMMKVDQSNTSNRQKMIARRAGAPTAVPAPPIFNAPTTVSAPSTTNVTSTTTTLRNNDRVIDSLSFVT